MKLKTKHILIALTTLAFLPGCNKFNFTADDLGDENPKDEVPQSELQVISFGVKTTDVDVTTRSVGSVNAWDSHQLYIYGYNNNESKYELNNVPVNAPGYGLTDPIAPINADDNNDYFYYNPNNHIYDFWGYYVDDAYKVTGSETSPVPVIADDNSVSLDIKINGSQDVMYAMAIKSNDVKNSITEDKLYSAYSARRNIVPTLTFEHLLSKFNLYMRSGSEEGDNITVTDVIAMGQAEGTLVIVGSDSKTRGLTPKASQELVDFALKSTTLDSNGQLEEFTDLDMAGTDGAGSGTGLLWAPPAAGKSTPIGAGFMLFPGVESYDIEFKFEQGNQTSTMPIKLMAKSVTNSANQNAGLTVFEAGKEYDITITVYGLERIEINAKLSDWENMGDIVYDPDNVWGRLSYEVFAVVSGGLAEDGVTPLVEVGDILTVHTEIGSAFPVPGHEVYINDGDPLVDDIAVPDGTYIVINDDNKYEMVVAGGKIVTWTEDTTPTVVNYTLLSGSTFTVTDGKATAGTTPGDYYSDGKILTVDAGLNVTVTNANSFAVEGGSVFLYQGTTPVVGEYASPAGEYNIPGGNYVLLIGSDYIIDAYEEKVTYTDAPSSVTLNPSTLELTVSDDGDAATTVTFKYIVGNGTDQPLAYDFTSLTSHNEGTTVTLTGATVGDYVYVEVKTVTGGLEVINYYAGIL